MKLIVPTRWGVLIGFVLSTIFWILIIKYLDRFDDYLHKILEKIIPTKESKIYFTNSIFLNQKWLIK